MPEICYLVCHIAVTFLTYSLTRIQLPTFNDAYYLQRYDVFLLNMRLIKVLRKTTMMVALLGLSSLFTLHAGELGEIVEESKKINDSAAASQQKIDAISDEIQSKLQQYKSTLKETEGLKVYNAQMGKQIDNQMTEMANINQSIDNVTIIERQITPLMLRMIDALDELIAADVPFLMDERATRIAGLKETMDRADVAVSEKFRRILEAYQIEIDYGKTIEAYSGNIVINDAEQSVNFLRIGRIALIYQSRDKNLMGVWNVDTNSWDELDSSYQVAVTKGLRMAQKQLAPDMINVPVRAAEGN